MEAIQMQRNIELHQVAVGLVNVYCIYTSSANLAALFYIFLQIHQGLFLPAVKIYVAE